MRTCNCQLLRGHLKWKHDSSRQAHFPSLPLHGIVHIQPFLSFSTSWSPPRPLLSAQSLNYQQREIDDQLFPAQIDSHPGLPATIPCDHWKSFLLLHIMAPHECLIGAKMNIQLHHDAASQAQMQGWGAFQGCLTPRP